MNTASPVHTKWQWLTRKESERILECDPRKFVALVTAAGVRQREGYGYRRYCREDIERLATPPTNAA
jgi:hypothetical protein